MDWYYPILGGALRGAQASARIAERWDEFVVDGLGIRCVDDRPWVTGAETCELVMALEEEFGCEIPDDAAEKILTVKDAIDFISSHS